MSTKGPICFSYTVFHDPVGRSSERISLHNQMKRDHGILSGREGRKGLAQCQGTDHKSKAVFLSLLLLRDHSALLYVQFYSLLPISNTIAVTRGYLSSRFLVNWSLIPMIMSVHVSIVIAGAVPVCHMHFTVSQYNPESVRRLYFPTMKKHVLHRFSTYPTEGTVSNSVHQTLAVIVCRWLGVPCSGVAILNPLIMLFTRIDFPRQGHCACANAFCAVRLHSLHWKHDATALKMGTWCTF